MPTCRAWTSLHKVTHSPHKLAGERHCHVVKWKSDSEQFMFFTWTKCSEFWAQSTLLALIWCFSLLGCVKRHHILFAVVKWVLTNTHFPLLQDYFPLALIIHPCFIFQFHTSCHVEYRASPFSHILHCEPYKVIYLMTHLIIFIDCKYALWYMGQVQLKKVVARSKNSCLDKRTGDWVRKAR